MAATFTSASSTDLDEECLIGLEIGEPILEKLHRFALGVRHCREHAAKLVDLGNLVLLEEKLFVAGT